MPHPRVAEPETTAKLPSSSAFRGVWPPLLPLPMEVKSRLWGQGEWGSTVPGGPSLPLGAVACNALTLPGWPRSPLNSPSLALLGKNKHQKNLGFRQEKTPQAGIILFEARSPTPFLFLLFPSTDTNRIFNCRIAVF